jgi:hypothetical protein
LLSRARNNQTVQSNNPYGGNYVCTLYRNIDHHLGCRRSARVAPDSLECFSAVQSAAVTSRPDTPSTVEQSGLGLPREVTDLSRPSFPQYDLNAYYYAYSTIAQTLAGAFGFLVAVVLYQMQRLESEMEAAVIEVIDLIGCTSSRGHITRRHAKCHDWEKVNESLTTLCHERATKEPRLDDAARAFTGVQLNFLILAHRKLEAIPGRIRTALLGTSIVIASCFLLIALTPIISLFGTWLGVPFLVIVLGGSSYCLRSYWRMARRLVEQKPKVRYSTSANGHRAGSINIKAWD